MAIYWIIALTVLALFASLAATFCMWRAANVKNKSAQAIEPLRWDRAPSPVNDAMHYALSAQDKADLAHADMEQSAELNRLSAIWTLGAVFLNTLAALISVLALNPPSV